MINKYLNSLWLKKKLSIQTMDWDAFILGRIQSPLT